MCLLSLSLNTPPSKVLLNRTSKSPLYPLESLSMSGPFPKHPSGFAQNPVLAQHGGHGHRVALRGTLGGAGAKALCSSSSLSLSLSLSITLSLSLSLSISITLSLSLSQTHAVHSQSSP